MRYKGKIKKLNYIVVSDPSYGNDVEFRYEKDNLKKVNWKVNIDIYPVKYKFNKITVRGTEFHVLLCEDDRICRLEDKGNYRYSKQIQIKQNDIYMDTACVAFGINEKADEIIKSQKDWQPDCSLRTATDGVFGTVIEGKVNDDTKFILMSGYISKDTQYSLEDIIGYLQFQLNITELEKEKEDIDKNMEK